MQCPRRGRAWDAGCGNGQASVALAAQFEAVFATDPSAEQVAAATPHPRVTYAVEPAEQCSLADRSVDLVTVAQALHWFDPDRFHAEVARVLRPDGVVAAWSYERCLVTPTVDAVFERLYGPELGAWWPPERRHVEARYTTLPFPYVELPTPVFELRCAWTLAQYLAYLRTWSACQRRLRAEGIDAVAGLADAFAQAWGAPDTVRPVHWPLALRIGRLDKP